jgi:uncharacterized protein (TIGR00725 family)
MTQEDALQTLAGRRPVIGVMGSGSDEHRDLAEPLGEWLAGQGFHLLTGGGGGVMAATSRAFHRVAHRRGLVIGIVPGLPGDAGFRPPPGYPNPWVEVAILTHLPLSGEQGTGAMSRNHLNVLSSSVLVALPGRTGTRSEVELAVRYRRPVIAHLGDRGTISGLPASRVPVARDLQAVQEFVLARTARPPEGAEEDRERWKTTRR